MKKVTQFLTLFTSFSTLLCCALPALLVSLGLGAAMAGFLSKYPQLIWLSENKLFIFIAGGMLLGLGGILQFSLPKKECPIDFKEACEETKDWSKPLYFVSLIIYLIGFAFAYVLPRFL